MGWRDWNPKTARKTARAIGAVADRLNLIRCMVQDGIYATDPAALLEAANVIDRSAALLRVLSARSQLSSSTTPAPPPPPKGSA